MQFNRRLAVIVAMLGSLFGLPAIAQVATLDPVRPECMATPGKCEKRDAIVFVHGIYGGAETFKNTTTNFDWPSRFPRSIDANQIDVFRLNYQTALFAWARAANPSFDQLANAVFAALKPLRIAQYRSVGFIAHSLGGNVISTYVHMVKTGPGHPQRSQNAFIITLATPVLGSQFADLALTLKTVLFMSDPLLDSLKANNLYLTMLEQFREREEGKERRYVCRPVNLHAAVEGKYLGLLLAVNLDSAALPISEFVKSPIIGFSLNHDEIAKPANESSLVYRWVLARVTQEYQRLATWDQAHLNAPPKRRLCELMDFLPEDG